MQAIGSRVSRNALKYSWLAALVPIGIVCTLLLSQSPAGAQTTVPLGTAQSFAVLGGSAVTNTGPTLLNGDLGVWSGTSITGFPPGIVNGNTHDDDAVAMGAQSDSTTAYNFAAGQSPTGSLSGSVGAGQTLKPGVYNESSALLLNGTLYLDAQGDPAAVFIFQIGSTLTTGSASHVVLIGGAQACNVFWQVGSSATLGTGSSFTGTILALASITVTTNDTVMGRALAQTGAVTLDSDTITVPSCAAPPTTAPPTGPTVTPTGPTATPTGPTRHRPGPHPHPPAPHPHPPGPHPHPPGPHPHPPAHTHTHRPHTHTHRAHTHAHRAHTHTDRAHTVADADRADAHAVANPHWPDAITRAHTHPGPHHRPGDRLMDAPPARPASPGGPGRRLRPARSSGNAECDRNARHEASWRAIARRGQPGGRRRATAGTWRRKSPVPGTKPCRVSHPVIQSGSGWLAGTTL